MPFQPLNVPPAPEPPEGMALVVAVHHGRSVFVVDDRVPDGGLFLGVLDGRWCYAVDVRDETDVDVDLFRDLRVLWGTLDEVTWTIAGRAAQLVDWDRTTRFCGQCGSSTAPMAGERARRCPRCELVAYPRLAPAVITLVTDDDDRVLLARNPNFPAPFFSILAGFVEPGETLEEAVAREVQEEVGLVVGDVQYWGSQPWPFPHSLMVGFTARALAGELVLDPTEIAEAAWYTPDDLPQVPPRMSIAGRMIDDWARATRG